MANKSIKDAFQRFWEYVTAKVDSQKMLLVTAIHAADSDSGNYECDATFAEIQAALQAGRPVRLEMYVSYGNSNWTYEPFMLKPDEEVIFVSAGDVTSNKVIRIDANNNVTAESKNFALVTTNAGGGSFAASYGAAAGNPGGYYIRGIKFSETAETPTKEGDICFKLK